MFTNVLPKWPTFVAKGKRVSIWNLRCDLISIPQSGISTMTKVVVCQNKIESQSQTASNFLYVKTMFVQDRVCQDHDCQDHVWQDQDSQNYIRPDHACQDYFCWDHIWQNHVCQDHVWLAQVCPDHVCLDHVCPDHIFWTMYVKTLFFNTMSWSIFSNLINFDPISSSFNIFDHAWSSLIKFNQVQGSSLI